jgi:hypothetical protein
MRKEGQTIDGTKKVHREGQTNAGKALKEGRKGGRKE